MTEWKETRFSEKPDLLLRISPTKYLQTRNAKLVTDEEYGDSWVCESREVGEDEIQIISTLEDQSDTLTDVMLAMTELASQIGGE